MRHNSLSFRFIDGPINFCFDEKVNKTTGATAIFEGSVRADNFNGKLVNIIEFTAHAEMAQKICESLMTELQKKYKLNSIEIHHSLGEVKAGQVCFTVSIKSAHRKEAFSALAEMVDEFKSKVPVFGKEILEDGSYAWKQNT
jgi:molybdopterin synthase catalytic subunit